MAGQYQEVEVKLHVPDLQVVTAQLLAAGAILAKPRVYERNVRYENADNTLTASDIVLRLRQDDAVRLTYKEPLNPESIERGLHSRFEAEVTVSDFDVMDTILVRLGYHQAMIYEKYRTTYALGRAEIVLDEMPYGNFVEIEADEATINHLLVELKLDSTPRIPHSYADLFIMIRSALSLTFIDLTFENFKSIQVPASLITGD